MEFPQEGEDGHQAGGAALPESSHESMKNEEPNTVEGFSKGEGLLSPGMGDMKQPTGQDDQTDKMTPNNTFQSSSVRQIMRETLDDLSEDELNRFKRIFRDHYKIPWSNLEKAVSDDIVEQIVQKFCVENSAEVMVKILRTMGKNQLATDLEKEIGIVNSTPQDKEKKSKLKIHLQSILRDKCFLVHQELGDQQLHVIYTELTVVEGRPVEVNTTHEVSTMHLKLIEKKSSSVTMNSIKLPNIFYHAGKPVTKVLTLGIAGVGKSVAVQKFVLDWAEEKNNQDIELVFVLPFRELNLYKMEYSLFDLLLKFYPKLEELKEITDLKGAVLIVLDGLDESRLQLDFKDKDKLICDTKEKASVAILITSLITGNLLPSALIWVTTRPAAANKDLCDLFHLVTEIQGFDEGHREEYFKKVIPKKSEQIMKHIKSKRSLYIMCHIPVFCRITAMVLGEMGEKQRASNQEMPNTLTEMYTQFSVFQITRMEKYLNEKMRPEEKGQLLVKLGKLAFNHLAFNHLEKGTLIFYEKDLTECDIDVNTGALQAGLCTQIFKKSVSGESMFSFVHLSVQEFLAALYLIHTHATERKNLLIETSWEKISSWFNNSRFDLYKMAVDKALESECGHLDLCVRFLLGLAPILEPRIRHPLDMVLPQLAAREVSIQKTAEYIKEKISKSISPERIINLFHCLNELGDNSLVEEINSYMSSADEEKNLTPAQCSALTYLLLMSAEDFEEFDLKKYLRSEEGLYRMLPVVEISRRVWLNQCHLSQKSCELMASVLQRTPSHLTEMDLSDNDLKDSGVQLLSDGLSSPNCKLQTLRLSLCLITHVGCSLLASALKSNPSYLKELDVSYNHPGASGVKELTDRLNDPNCKLETFRYDHGGAFRTKPGPRKYACELTLDPNTAHRRLSLSDGNRKVTRVSECQPYPDHPERFDSWPQVLCREGLSGRCYWEAEWSGDGHTAVAYKSIQRKGWGGSEYSEFGSNAKSWSLYCSGNSYSAWHNSKQTAIPAPSSRSSRVGVYLDWPAGTLSFYSVSSDTLTHLHTLHSTFTEPLCPGFYVWSDSSVSLCQIT